MGRRWRVAGGARSGVAQCVMLCAGAVVLSAPLRAQDAKAIVQQAVNRELEQARDDHSHWRYIENEDGGAKYVVVETEHGALKKRTEEYGRPVSAAGNREQDANIQKFIHDPALQEKQRENGAHDDKDATELLNEMPVAFLWKFERETADEFTLSYRPNPDYRPPDMEARVMGQMAGMLVVSKQGHRIKTFKGTLTDDISIGWGLLARIKAGGTFDVERRQVGQGLWCITETHVHISGHALFFKTIGQQEDVVKTDFTLVPAGTTLEQGVGMLTAPPVAKGCCGR